MNKGRQNQRINKMSKWIMVSEQLPPPNQRVLAYGPTLGIVTVEYHYYPAWQPFDEEKYKNVTDERMLPIIDNLRTLNKMDKGKPEKHSWACACEESYWDIDTFHCWMPLPEEPKGEVFQVAVKIE